MTHRRPAGINPGNYPSLDEKGKVPATTRFEHKRRKTHAQRTSWEIDSDEIVETEQPISIARYCAGGQTHMGWNIMPLSGLVDRRPR
jgi:hypothetical protein